MAYKIYWKDFLKELCSLLTEAELFTPQYAADIKCDCDQKALLKLHRDAFHEFYNQNQLEIRVQPNHILFNNYSTLQSFFATIGSGVKVSLNVTGPEQLFYIYTYTPESIIVDITVSDDKCTLTIGGYRHPPLTLATSDFPFGDLNLSEDDSPKSAQNDMPKNETSGDLNTPEHQFLTEEEEEDKKSYHLVIQKENLGNIDEEKKNAPKTIVEPKTTTIKRAKEQRSSENFVPQKEQQHEKNKHASQKKEELDLEKLGFFLPDKEPPTYSIVAPTAEEISAPKKQKIALNFKKKTGEISRGHAQSKGKNIENMKKNLEKDLKRKVKTPTKKSIPFTIEGTDAEGFKKFYKEATKNTNAEKEKKEKILKKNKEKNLKALEVFDAFLCKTYDMINVFEGGKAEEIKECKRCPHHCGPQGQIPTRGRPRDDGLKSLLVKLDKEKD